MGGLPFGIGPLLFSIDADSPNERQAAIAKAFKLPGVELRNCWFNQSAEADAKAREKLSLPSLHKIALANIPASGNIRLRLHISMEKQRQYLDGSRPDTGTEDFELSVEYGPLIPTAFSVCVNSSTLRGGANSVRVVGHHLHEWFTTEGVTRSTGVRLHYGPDAVPFPLDAVLRGADQSARFMKERTSLTPARLDSFVYSMRDNQIEPIDALWQLQKAMQYELSYLFYCKQLASERGEAASEVRRAADQLIGSHTSLEFRQKFRRLFQGGQAQQVALQVLSARKRTSTDMEFQTEALMQVHTHADLAVFQDVYDSIASDDFEPDLVYAESAVEVVETLRRSDFQVYVAAMVTLTVAMLTIASRALGGG
ncbi:hypothetical protein ACWCOV_10020 [Kribbella sp. NPDC002412]